MANDSLTQGSILKPLLKFAVPVIFALILQSLYGAVDLMVVHKCRCFCGRNRVTDHADSDWCCCRTFHGNYDSDWSAAW